MRTMTHLKAEPETMETQTKIDFAVQELNHYFLNVSTEFREGYISAMFAFSEHGSICNRAAIKLHNS